MSIQTNRLDILFHIDAIEQDFAFIRLERKEGSKKRNWKGAFQLDYLLGEKYLAHAVLSPYGRYAYAMFKKPIDVYNLLSQIKSDDKFDDNTTKEVLPRASRHDSPKENPKICEAWLAQIFLNSLSSSRSRFPQFHYCNLTGALLLVPDIGMARKDYLDVIKIEIDRDFLIQARTVRFRKKIAIINELSKTKSEGRRKTLKNALNGPEYIFQVGTGSLRRLLPRDGKMSNKSIYLKCGLYKKKASTQFLDFKNMECFAKSRAGVLQDVFEKMEKYFGKYMDIRLSDVEPEHTIELRNSILKKVDQIRPFFEGQAIRIVDRVGDEKSLEMKSLLKKLLSHYLPDDSSVSVGKLDRPGDLNLRIIHEAKYYEENKIKDQYRPSTHDIQRQNITVELADSIVDKIVKANLKELLIKHDIHQRKITLFDWKRLGTKKEWIFGQCDEKLKRVVFLKIFPDGSLEFKEIDGQNIFEYQEFKKYIELMSKKKEGGEKKKRGFEGLIISEDQDINYILRTEEVTLPDLPALKSIIKEIDKDLPENLKNGKALASLVEQYIAGNPEADTEKMGFFLKTLNEIGKGMISKWDLKMLISENLGNLGKNNKWKSNTTAAKNFIGFLLEKHNIRLKFPQDKQSKNELFDAALNIKFFGETDREAFYFVGEQRDSVRQSFRNACHIRKIIAVEDSKLVFRQLLRTMDVDFVRTGQSTVIPFPFKYIREFMGFPMLQ
jgi:hypothetical protein